MCLRNPSAAPGLAARLLLRTLLVFARSIKPHERAQAVESEGNSRRDSRLKFHCRLHSLPTIRFHSHSFPATVMPCAKMEISSQLSSTSSVFICSLEKLWRPCCCDDCCEDVEKCGSARPARKQERLCPCGQR